MPDWNDENPGYTSPFDDDGQYDPENEHPIAKLYRREYDAACMRMNVVNRLLASLSPADARIPLFTFRECREWGLRKNARRSVE